MAANDYCAWSDVEAVNPDITWGSTYDTVGAAIVTRASRMIDRYAGVEPGYFYVSSDTTRWFSGSGSAWMWIGRLAAAPTTVSMAVGGVVDGPSGTGGTYTALTAADYLIWPPNALLMGEPYQRLDIAGSTYTAWKAGDKTIKIAGKFGWAGTLPDELKQAAIIETSKQLQRGRQGYQDTGAIVELGQMTYTQPLDPATVAILDAFLKKIKPRKGSQ